MNVLPLTPPLDLQLSLEGFRRWGDDGLDRWDGRRLLRTARIDGRAVAYRAEASGNPSAPVLAIQSAEMATASEQIALASAVRAAFLTAPPEFPELVRADAVVAAADARFPGLRPILQPDVFTALVRSVTAQQLSLRWAAVIRRRIAETFGDCHDLGNGDWVISLSPQGLAASRPEDLRALQLSGRQSAAIIGIAQASLEGRLDQRRLEGLSDDDVIADLVQLQGVGRWSAEWILARTLGRPVVVAGDLGVRKAVGRAYLGVDLATEQEVRRATAHWGPSAGIAQSLLLATLLTAPPAASPAWSGRLPPGA